MSDAPYRATIAELVERSYRNSKAHGFWDNEDTDETVPSKLMLMVSELGEALECYRDPASDDMVKVPVEVLEDLISAARSTDPIGAGASREADAGQPFLDKHMAKPKGLDIELADALIRIFDFCGRYEIDIEGAIERKAEYNKGRPLMHGRKV